MDVAREPLTPLSRALLAVAAAGLTLAGCSKSETAQARSRRQKTKAEQVPLLKSALDVLGAQVVSMDDDFDAAPPAAGTAARPQTTDSEES